MSAGGFACLVFTEPVEIVSRLKNITTVSLNWITGGIGHVHLWEDPGSYESALEDSCTDHVALASQGMTYLSFDVPPEALRWISPAGKKWPGGQA